MILLAAALALGQPNLLLLTMDDTGTNLFESYGEDDRWRGLTPRITTLARDALQLSHFYAYPACTTTRTALLSGQHAFRTGTTASTPAPEIPGTLLARALDGYTCVHVGKWHVGWEYGGLDPILWGFDFSLGHKANPFQSGGQSYYGYDVALATPARLVPMRVEGPYLTDFFADAAVLAIEAIPEPWFINVGLHDVHKPFTPVPGGKGVTEEEIYREKLSYLDGAVGRILDAVNLDTTIVLLMGDNGTIDQFTLRDGTGKTTLWQEGIRVPAWLLGPHGITDADSMILATDFYAQALAWAGLRGSAPDSVPFGQRKQGYSQRVKLGEECRWTAFDDRYKFVRNQRTIRGELREITREGVTDVVIQLPYTPEQQAAFDELEASGEALRAEGPYVPCGPPE